MANTFIDIGKIVPVFTGDYSPSRVYEFNDLVRSNNIIYWHVERDSTVGVQPPAAGVWMKLLTSGGEGGGGSNVHVDAIQTEGTHIADITVDGEVVALYAPEGAMGEPVTVSETETGDILIKGQGGTGGGDSYDHSALELATQGITGTPVTSITTGSSSRLATTRAVVDYVATHGGGGSATDVQINGVSITEDGVANIPVASTTQLGAVKMGGASNGIGLGSSNQLYVASATDAEIGNRGSNYKPIVPKNLDSAVTAVLTDGKAPALSDAQKAAAQSWLGIDTILGLVEAVSEVVG